MRLGSLLRIDLDMPGMSFARYLHFELEKNTPVPIELTDSDKSLVEHPFDHQKLCATWPAISFWSELLLERKALRVMS